MTSDAEQLGFRGATGTRGAADRDDGDGGIDEIGCYRGEERQHRRGRVAARHGDAPGVAQRVTMTRELGQPVRPTAGMRRAVEALPRAGVAQPEIGATIHDQGLRAELFRQRGRMAVRQAQEDHIVAVEDGDLGGLQHPLGQWQQVRMVIGERGSGAPGGGQRADRQPSVVIGGVPEQ